MVLLRGENTIIYTRAEVKENDIIMTSTVLSKNNKGMVWYSMYVCII